MVRWVYIEVTIKGGLTVITQVSTSAEGKAGHILLRSTFVIFSRLPFCFNGFRFSVLICSE